MRLATAPFKVSKSNSDHFCVTLTLALKIKMFYPPNSISGLGLECIQLHRDVFQTTINTWQQLVTTLAVTLVFPVCLHCHSAYKGSISDCLLSDVFSSSRLDWTHFLWFISSVKDNNEDNGVTIFYFHLCCVIEYHLQSSIVIASSSQLLNKMTTNNKSTYIKSISITSSPKKHQSKTT